MRRASIIIKMLVFVSLAILGKYSQAQELIQQKCGNLDPSDVSQLALSIDCVTAASKDFAIQECQTLSPDVEGDAAKAAICSGKLGLRLSSLKDEYVQVTKDNTSLSGKLSEMEDDLNLAKRSISTLEKALSERESQLAMEVQNSTELSNKLKSVSVGAWHTFSVGEYDRGAIFRPRHYCGHDTAKEAQNLCGPRRAEVKLVLDQSGDKCGYQNYVVACLIK